ncbi:MAG: CoA transferase, partial [Bacteroidota bacterium]|nr:CoA transferase [Bacteroidota bacterium]MDX5429568.1 CoA transferase [Bacteroidota bacterium]MDX5468355.1 CoA transferase [Bacteroidota bacterium]
SYFASANYHKEYLELDLLKEEDKQLLFHHLEDTDILISNFKPGDDKKFGILSTDLLRRFPKLIHGQITGYPGNNTRPAFDVVLQAETGYLAMTGHPNEAPVKMPVAMIDVLAAHQLKEGLLIALIERNQSGKGALVSVSLYDAALSALSNQASAFLMGGLIPQALGTLHPSICPYGELLPCSDGKSLVLAVGNDTQFRHLCEVLGDSQLAEHPSFHSNPERVKNRVELQKQLAQLSASFSSDVLFEALDQQKVPVGRIRRLDEVFQDPEAQTLVREETIENTLTRRVSGNIFRIQSA